MWLSAWESPRKCPHRPGFLSATSVAVRQGAQLDSRLVPCSLLVSHHPCDVRCLTTKVTPPSQTPVLEGLLNAIMITPWWGIGSQKHPTLAL